MVVIFVMIVAPTVSKESPSNVEITFSNLKILKYKYSQYHPLLSKKFETQNLLFYTLGVFFFLLLFFLQHEHKNVTVSSMTR